MPLEKKTENLHIKLTPSQKESLRELADEYGLDVSSFVLLVIENFVESTSWQEGLHLVRRSKIKSPHEKIAEGLRRADDKRDNGTTVSSYNNREG